MLFDLNKLGKLKTAELEEIIEGYVKASPDIKVVKLENNKERAIFIETIAEDKEGYPHQLTEEDIAQNVQWSEEGLMAGDFVLLPFPDEETDARAAMLTQLTELTAEMTDEEKAKYLPWAESAPNEAVAEAINVLIGDKEAVEEKADKKDEEEQETPAEAETDDVPDAEEDPEEADMNRAIKAGTLRFENHMIINVRPKIANGRLKYEMDAPDGTSYLATKEELEAAVQTALANIK